MSALNKKFLSYNIFEKFYLQQTNKSNADKNSSNRSLNTNISSLSSSFQSINPEFNIDNSHNFIKCFHKSVIPYLSISDLINLKKCSKLLNSIVDEKAIKICIISNSIKNFSSNESRLNIWSHYMNLNKFISVLLLKYYIKKENIDNENIDINKIQEEYYKYTGQIVEKIKNNEELKEEEKKLYDPNKIKAIQDSLDFIKRDIDRTLYTDFFLKEGGKEQLSNILERMCIVPGNIGYCQGMNFIVGSMLTLFRNEVKTFYLFSCMIQTYDLINLFAYNTPDYGIRVYQINYYVKKYIPNVFYHFKNNNLSFDIIYSRWLLTLFSNYLEINRLDFPWSCFFIHKWKGLIKLCLILIYELKDILVKCDLASLSSLLKEDSVKYHNNYMKSFYLYNKKFKITNEELKQLRNEYFIDLAKKKLELTNGKVEEWEEDQKGPLNEYLEEKNKLENNSLKVIENYKKLNEEANKKYIIAFNQYTSYMKGVKLFQKSIDKVATDKLEYDKIISHYDYAINNADMNKNIIIQKNNINENNNNGQKYNNNKNEEELDKKRQIEIKNKKSMLLKEKNKIIEKYNPIKHEFDFKTDLLYKKCDTIDKYKSELDLWINEKNKIKEEMQNYLFGVEQKNNDLIQILSEKLKLSENYKKYYKF